MKKKFDLIVNPDPVTPARFAARLGRCQAELGPFLDDLVRRHPPEVVFAALLAELEEGAGVLYAYGRMNREILGHVIRRLRQLTDSTGP